MLIDPSWLRNGGLGSRTAVEDVYFAEEAPEDPRAVALDEALATLPPPLEEAVALRVHAGLSYRQIAAHFGWFCGSPPELNGKRAHRAVRRGLAQLRHRIETDPEMQFLEPGSDA